ncbi:hypothetical protein ACCO45_013199 [Purpureocillium lilacinum]|uniref:Uncharacterized protein n=1 Tax=Purpureocillium lilacinum TaxID=33203 RepID=A0ACC4DAI0_PURLI
MLVVVVVVGVVRRPTAPGPGSGPGPDSISGPGPGSGAAPRPARVRVIRAVAALLWRVRRDPERDRAPGPTVVGLRLGEEHGVVALAAPVRSGGAVAVFIGSVRLSCARSRRRCSSDCGRPGRARGAAAGAAAVVARVSGAAAPPPRLHPIPKRRLLLMVLLSSRRRRRLASALVVFGNGGVLGRRDEVAVAAPPTFFVLPPPPKRCVKEAMRRSFPNGCAVADDAEGSARAFGADRGAVAVSAGVVDEGEKKKK